MTRRSMPRTVEEVLDTLQRTISVDFDGVLHPYTDGWCGSAPTDEDPTPGARSFLKHMTGAGYRVVVSSCRADHDAGHDGIISWLTKHDLMQYVDDVTCEKPAAVAYVDDRAVHYDGSWATVERNINRLAAARASGEVPPSRQDESHA